MKDELKVTEEIISKICIREVCILGSGNGDKSPPVLIKFGHPTERNQILPFSKNLKKGLEIDKNVPKIYQKKHKEFKRKAWKLKMVHDIQTQVVFDGFQMVLRYKLKDNGPHKYNYVIHSDWIPSPNDLSSSLSSSLSRDPGKHDTPVIDSSVEAKSNRTIILSGVCETVTTLNLETVFSAYFKKADYELIDEMKTKVKGTVLITCKDWSGCKHIADSYRETKLLEKEIKFTLFNETGPTN